MKEIRGSASAVVRASAQDCYALLAAVDRYGSWNGDLVRELEVLEREPDGSPVRLRAQIYVKQSPFMKTFELTVAIRNEPPNAVHITRLPNEPTDREGLELSWRILPEGSGALLELQFMALASFVPGFLPLGGVGNLIAETLLESATEALGGLA